VSVLDFRYQAGGIHLPRLQLWLDGHMPQLGPEKVFVSHAHADHIGGHREVICTEPTARFMNARIGGQRREHVLPFNQPTGFTVAGGEFELTLLAAGHIFCSAMAWIRADDMTLLYTGDFKLRAGLSAERCEPRPAEVLIMETTYGRPHYQFPPAADIIAGIVRFCRETLDNDEVPVLLGYSLGKSQELLCGLAEANLAIMLHGQIYKHTQLYEQLGRRFPPYEPYVPGQCQGKVLVCPPNANHSLMLKKLGSSRTAVLTGWAVDPECRYRHQVDAAFPLSDHADFGDLLRFVEQVKPRKVYTLHGFAADFSQTLRDRGYDSQALSQPDQLAWPLLSPPKVRTSPLTAPPSLRPELVPPGRLTSRDQAPSTAGSDQGPAPPAPWDVNSFGLFATICGRIAGASRKLEKVSILSDYLKALPPASLGEVTVWFTGYPFAPTENKVLQLGWAIIRDALGAVTGVSEFELGQVYLKHSDLGETAAELLAACPPARSPLTLEVVARSFAQLQAARGPSLKLPILRDTLAHCTAPEAKYLVKILTGDLRIGLKEGLVEEGIARAFGAALDEVKRTNLLLGHTGETAILARAGTLAQANLVPFRPIKFMLASPVPSAAEAWERMHPTGAPESGPTIPAVIWLEDKYDGIRCQLHKVGARVELYSRDLKSISRTFEDVVASARELADDVILDGELLAKREQVVLPFAELQKRLGRRENDLFLREEIPVQFVAFDLIWRNGCSRLNTTLRDRRAELVSLALPALLDVALVIEADSEAAIDDAFAAARRRGNEGLMIKEPSSSYTPGRRGLAWLKLKKTYGTLDCVVVGAEYGHGKRKDVLSDYTFAIRDESTGELKTIGKAYSGLTDAEIAQLTEHFLHRAVRQHGRYFEVVPDTVLEIGFDIIQPSRRHQSGLALRFPRILRIRTDKTPADIDTLATARRLVVQRTA
jgi:DNA ligase-1